MKQELRDKWTAALRSDDYKQCQNTLRRVKPYKPTVPSYCCLGVLCEVAEQPFRYKRLGAMGLTSFNQSLLMHLNDRENWTFPQIADWIETHIPLTDKEL